MTVTEDLAPIPVPDRTRVTGSNVKCLLAPCALNLDLSNRLHTLFTLKTNFLHICSG